jgi:hypothetical protein
VVVVLAGLGVMASSPVLRFDPGRALGGVLSQLGGTLWPAIAASLAVTLQVAAGASLVRIARWSAYASLSEAMVAGAVGAIAIDLFALVVLGPLGLFGWLPLALGLVAITAAGFGARPFFSPGVLHAPRADLPAWLLVGLVWSAPVLLQLASPLAPFVDVLPNHVAPVEHLRTFGHWDQLAVSPSPIYGPSRIFLGYVAMLGTTASLSGLDAGLAVAAFALPLTVLFAASARLVARTLGSGRAAHGLGRAREGWEPIEDPEATSAAYWVLLTIPLTFAFLRLPDTRATVLAFIPACLALVLTLDGSRWGGWSRSTMLAVSLGVGLLVHPAIGGFAVGTVALIGLVSASRTRAAFAGIAGGTLMAAPALLVVIAPTVSPFVALPFALAGATLAAMLGDRATRDDWSMPRAAGSAFRMRPILLGLGGVVLLMLGLLLLIAVRPTSLGGIVAEAVAGLLDWGLLLIALVPFAVLVRSPIAWLALGCALLVGVGSALVAGALGRIVPGSDVLISTLAYELPKSAGYWVPWVLAIAAGLGLAAFWALRDLPGLVRVGAVSAFVVLASLSFRPDALEPEAIEQHRYAEVLGISLANAQDGYWVGHPDTRRILDEPRRELVAAVRAEVAAGRLGATSQVLHVAPSFQQWEATPLGVFAGVMESTATPDAERSIHTYGGRLYPLADLDTLLRQAYPYVVVEGYAEPVVERVRAAGYAEVWRNERAVLLRRDG